MSRDFKPDVFKLQELVAQGIPMKPRERESPADTTPTTQSEGVSEIPKPIERTKRKTIPKGDYESLFLEALEFKERRAVYISREKHQQISYILKTIDSGEVTVGAFVEQILDHHLELYREEIDALYELRCKKPSQRFQR